MENHLKTIDALAGRIDLRYNGFRGYKNWFAGLITLIIYAMTFIVSIYFFRNMFLRIDPKSYTVKKYVDAGGATFDPKNLFHFFSLVDSKTNKPISIEKEYFTVDGYTMYVTTKKIINYKYDKCKKADFYSLEEFFVEKDLKDYYCLSKMVDLRIPNNTNYISNIIDKKQSSSSDFNKNSQNSNADTSSLYKNFNDTERENYNYKKYADSYDYTDENNLLNPNFIYPWMTIEKSDRVQYIIYYQIDIKKCVNSTDKDYLCKSEEEIDSLTDTLYFQLKFVDNMFDVGNYSMPVNKYINNKSGVLKSQSTVNLYLNFYSVNVITRDGLIFDTSKVTETYSFDFHSESFSGTRKSLVHQTSFFILNDAQNYERSYVRLQNIAADIGGIYKFLIIIGSMLNYLLEKYSNYVINDSLIDILKLSLDSSSKTSSNLHFINYNFKSPKNIIPIIHSSFNNSGKAIIANQVEIKNFNCFKESNKNHNINQGNQEYLNQIANKKISNSNNCDFKPIIKDENNNNNTNNKVSNTTNYNYNNYEKSANTNNNLNEYSNTNNNYNKNISRTKINEDFISDVNKNSNVILIKKYESMKQDYEVNNPQIIKGLDNKIIKNYTSENKKNNINIAKEDNYQYVDNVNYMDNIDFNDKGNTNNNEKKLIEKAKHPINNIQGFVVNNPDNSYSHLNLMKKCDINNKKLNFQTEGLNAEFQPQKDNIYLKSGENKFNNFNNNICHQNLDTRKKFETNSYAFKESFKGFMRYICNPIKLSFSEKIIFISKLRNILLDEVNIYILYFEVARIKKFIDEELKQKNKLHSKNIYLHDLLENYFIYDENPS